MKFFPSWIEKLLRVICPEELYEQIEGDLIELYQCDLKTMTKQKARMRLIIAALRFFRPGILLRHKLSFTLTRGPMFQNYLKTTCRHVLKNKVNFSFKVTGLVLALLSFLVIVIYVSYQLSFDRYNKDYQNIYRVNSQWKENGELAKYALTPAGVGPTLKSEFPEVRSFARLGGTSRYLIRYEDKSFHAEGFTDADSTIFDVFSFHFKKGNKHALSRPGSIVLAESLAKQIFGEEDPLNKSISFVDRSNISLQVTGVIEDMPNNSHLNSKALMSFGALRDSFELAADPWAISIDGSTNLYIRLDGRAGVNEFTAKALPVIKKRITKHEGGLEHDYGISLQPLKNIYLDPPIYAEFCAKGNVVYVYIFSLLGFFLLTISSINYANLSISDFHKRHKEIGVRKVMGALKKQIAFHVVTETSLITLLSLVVSAGILYLLFPNVLLMLDANLRMDMLLQPHVLMIVGGMIALLIILSTAYPAYQLAVNNPVNDLKPGGTTGKKVPISRILLLTQFTISIVCICATFIVARQLEFIQTRDPGYDRQNMIVAYMPDHYPQEKNQVIKDEFAKLTGVEAVSFSTFRIAGAGYYRDWYRVEMEGEMKRVMLNEVFFDHDFFRTTGIPLVAGRSFDPNKSTDSHEAFIVNETAVREFGWTDPVGKRISYGYEEAGGEKWEGTVVGVVKDFNVYSLHRKIEPLVMRLPWSDWPGSCVHIRINGPFDQTIARIKKKYEEILPGFLLKYSVIDDLYNNQYQNERKTFGALQLSTWIIVVISALGIFSLSLCMSVRRMKEFGVRKVLGATTKQIAVLHVGDFMKIALLANSIALPVAYALARTWLEEFAYKTDVNNISFLLVTMLSFVLVTISAGYSALKSGLMNPLEVIKRE